VCAAEPRACNGRAGTALPRLARWPIWLWLARCVQVRLSILCAYLFGKSTLLVALVRWAGRAGALLRAAAQPAAALLGCAAIYSKFFRMLVKHML